MRRQAQSDRGPPDTPDGVRYGAPRSLRSPEKHSCVGAARKVSPNWSHETMTCHSSQKHQNTTPVMQAKGNETKRAYHWPDLSNLLDKSSVTQDHPGKSVSFFLVFTAVRGFTKILEKRLIFYFQND